MTPVMQRMAGPTSESVQFAEDVRRDLTRTPKQLSCRYLYDTLGSCLFDAICRLPWYPIPRAERQLLADRAHRIVAPLRDPVTIIALGCGSGEKTAMLVDGLTGAGRHTEVHLVDVSAWALEQTERRLAGLDRVAVVTHRAPYEFGLRRSAAERPVRGSTLVAFLGSNIGNYEPGAARALLGEIRQALRPGDALLLGADLVKPEAALLLAYDDPLGVTAAFNLNLLARINQELRGDFDLRRFAHRAVWNAAASRVEMHLVSRGAQRVEIPLADCRVSFAADEPIWTESSYKYEPQTVTRMGSAAGFRCQDQWVEPDVRFALTLFEAE